MADAQHFVQRCTSLQNLQDSVLEQRAHPRLPCDFTDRLARRLGEGHLADLGVELHHLEDADAPAVARVVTVVAPSSPREIGLGGLLARNACGPDLGLRWRVRLFALRAVYADQALRHDG